MVRRALMTRGLLVWTSMPSSTGNAQEGVRLGLPLHSTTHILQAPLGKSPLMWQRVGIFSPAAWAASRIVVPGAAWIGLVLIVRFTISVSP
jgi:hypothetical protein